MKTGLPGTIATIRTQDFYPFEGENAASRRDLYYLYCASREFLSSSQGTTAMRCLMRFLRREEGLSTTENAAIVGFVAFAGMRFNRGGDLSVITFIEQIAHHIKHGF